MLGVHPKDSEKKSDLLSSTKSMQFYDHCLLPKSARKSPTSNTPIKGVLGRKIKNAQSRVMTRRGSVNVSHDKLRNLLGSKLGSRKGSSVNIHEKISEEE